MTPEQEQRAILEKFIINNSVAAGPQATVLFPSGGDNGAENSMRCRIAGMGAEKME
jgi:hypothetical protein